MNVDREDFAARLRCAVAGLEKLAEDVDLPEDNDTTSSDEGQITKKEVSSDSTPDEDRAAAAPPMTGKGAVITEQNLFQHPYAHPVLLDLVLLKRYGPEWMEWEPEVLELRVPCDFRVQILSELNLHKIQAIKTLHFVDTFWQQWQVFVWCCMPLNGVPPDFRIMQVPTVAQSMVAVDIANRVRQDVPFNEELTQYLEQVHLHDGIFCPIEPLNFVTIEDWEEYPVDCNEIKSRWPEIRKSGRNPAGESVEDEQLRRMLLVRSYLEDNRSSLRAQLPLVINV